MSKGRGVKVGTLMKAASKINERLLEEQQRADSP